MQGFKDYLLETDDAAGFTNLGGLGWQAVEGVFVLSGTYIEPAAMRFIMAA